MGVILYASVEVMAHQEEIIIRRDLLQTLPNLILLMDTHFSNNIILYICT
jgi:hypothetical protein